MKLVVASATLDTALFMNFLGPGCTLLRIPGRMFPVEVHYRPRSIDADGDYVQLAVDEIVSIIRRDDDDDNDDGDCMRDKRDDGSGRKRSPRNGILCFLTSPDELEDAAAAVQDALSDTQRATIRTFLLSGRQSAEEQQDVFKSCDARKVVFATHIAETSVTINEIEYVIDCGLARTLSFDQVRNDNALVRQAISRSSAEQRKGRAGRTAPGVCIRLYSALEYDTLAPCPTSAILASPLHIAYLRLLQLRRTESPSTFGWVQSPPSAAWERTRQDLLLLGAISAGHGARGEVVTPLGAFAVDLELDNVFIAAFLYHCYEADVNSAALSHPLLTYGLTAASIILNAQTLLCWSKQRPEDSDKAHGELAAKWNASEYGDVLVALRAFTEYVGLEPPQPVASRQPANSNHHVDPALCQDAAPTDTVVDATEMGEDVSKPVEEENDDEDDDDKLLLRGATLHTKQEAWCKQSYFRFRGVNAVIKRRGELVGSLHLNRLSIENRDVISLRKHRAATCTSSPTDHELKTLRQLLAKSFMMQAAVRVGVTRFRTLTDDETFPSRSGFVVKIDEALPDVVVFASNLRTTRSHMIFMTPLTDEDLTAVVPSSVREQIVAMLDTRQAQRIVNVPSTVVASVHPKQLAKRIGGDAPQPFITLEEDNTAVIHAQQGRMEALLKNLEGFLDEEKQRSMRQVREVPLNGQCRIAVGAGGAMKGFLADDTTFISISMTTKQPTCSGCDSTMALSILENAGVPFETVGRIRPVRSGNCPIIVDFVSSRDAAVALAALRHSDDVAAACPLIDVAPLGAPWNNCKLLVSIRLIVELSSASDFETADDAATSMAPISDEALEHVIAALKRLFPHEERTSVDYEPHAKRLVLSACLEEEGSLSRARELTSMFKELEVIDSCQRFSSFTTFTVRVPLPLKCQLKPLCAMLVRRLRDHKQGLRAACRTCEIGGARYIEVSGTDRNDALQAAEFVSRSCEWSDIALRPEDVSLFCSKHMWQFLRSVLVQRKPKGDIEPPMFVVDYETRRVMFLGRSDKSAAAQTCIAEVVAAMRTDGHIDTTQCRLSKSAKPHMVRQAIEALRKRCDKSTIVWRGKYLEVVTTAANKDELIKSLGKNIDAINGVSVAHHRTSAPCRAPQRQAASCDDCSLCMDQLQASQLRLALCGCAFCTDCFANMISSPPLALPIQCPGCSCLVAVQDIEAVVPNALVWIAEQQRSLSLGGPNIDASGVTSDNGGALWMPCPQMSCQGVIALGDGLSPFAHCYGCGTAFCRTCQAAGVVRELHEGPCVTEKESALAHVLTPIHALMERRCPHPSCREVFLDFDGCFAVTCGACKKQFCGFCMEACAGDAHPHVTNCTRNPKPGNVFCQESVFEQLREEDACTAIHTYVEENRVPQCFYADIVADINKRLTSSARLSLDDICCVAASTSRRIEGSRVASECELVVTKVRNQDKLREVIEGALSALREADPSSAFKFSVCDFADVGNGTNALHTAVGELQKVLPGVCLSSDVLEPHASSVDAEQVAVRMYTSNQFFEELNRILRSHVRLTPTSFKCLQPYMALLLRGVARCTTRSPIIVYRGMKLTTSQQKTYEEGRTVLWRNLVSCTTDPTVAQSFGNVLFEIHLHASADISHWSLVPSENEVLVPPRTRLRVASVSADSIKLISVC